MKGPEITLSAVRTLGAVERRKRGGDDDCALTRLFAAGRQARPNCRRRHLRSGFLFRFRRHDAVSDLDADLRSRGFRDRTLCRAVD